MTNFYKIRPPFVVGPDGSPLTVELLPAHAFTHWTAAKKAEVVIAVDNGLISVDQACERYHLSHEELDQWRLAFYRCGVRALHAHRLNGHHRRRLS